MLAKWLLVVLFQLAVFEMVLAQRMPSPVVTLLDHYRASGGDFHQADLIIPSTPSGISHGLSRSSYASIDKNELADLMKGKFPALQLSIPFSEKIIEIELVSVNPLTPDFRVVTNRSAGEPVPYTPGLFYRGVIKGDDSSLVSFSIFDDQLMGMVSTKHENIIIGKLRSTGPEYIIYSDRDFASSPQFKCSTFDDPSYADQLAQYIESGSTVRTDNCVRLYYELDYDIFATNNLSIAQTVNWLTGIHNNVASIYGIESITTSLSEVFVWTDKDPYNGSSSLSELSIFKSVRPAYNGDLAQLLSMEPGGFGGVANGINSFCVPGSSYCYSDVDFEYNDVPVYSWTVNTITHEFGHLMGSYHTHNCLWPGGAIDDCGPIAGFPNEGNCDLGPDPVNGGTIMSYCHLTSFGINFANGFGPLPGDAIRGAVDAAVCLSSSCGPSAPAYCHSKGGTSGEWIQKVQLNDFANNSGAGSGYSDFTDLIVNLTAGSVVSFALTPGYSGTHYDEFFTIWLDVNQDYDFADPGETIFQSTETNSAISGTFAVPFGLTGTSRMRISMKFDSLSGPCELFSYGEVEDYTINFDPIVTYCMSAGNHADMEWIDYIALGTIERTSLSDSGYFDGTMLGTNLALNSVNTLTYSAGMYGYSKTEYWKAWIDYNADGDFEDSGEKIFSRDSDKRGHLTKTFTVPASATIGKTRMRISMKRNSSPDCCGTFSHGEVEDYSILIVPQNIAPAEGDVQLNIFPNPASTHAVVEWQKQIASGQLRLFDAAGRVLIEQEISKNEVYAELDLLSFPPGIYFIQVIDEAGILASRKIMIE